MATLAQSKPIHGTDYLTSNDKGFAEARVWRGIIDPRQLHNVATGWIRQLLRLLEATSLKEEAIDVLQSQSSTLDQCEWAERFVCGMTGADASSFLEHRRSQS